MNNNRSNRTLEDFEVTLGFKWKGGIGSDSWERNLIGVVEFIVHEASDDACLADGLVTQEDELVLGQSWNRRHFQVREATQQDWSAKSEQDLNTPRKTPLRSLGVDRWGKEEEDRETRQSKWIGYLIDLHERA